jgi:hypothetical protein
MAGIPVPGEPYVFWLDPGGCLDYANGFPNDIEKEVAR